MSRNASFSRPYSSYIAFPVLFLSPPSDQHILSDRPRVAFGGEATFMTFFNSFILSESTYHQRVL